MRTVVFFFFPVEQRKRLHLAVCKPSECAEVAEFMYLFNASGRVNSLRCTTYKKEKKKEEISSCVGDDVGSLAALDQLGQRVTQLRQLEDLPVQQLQQGAQALGVGLPLQLAALQTLLQVAQLRLQLLVPRLRLLDETKGVGGVRKVMICGRYQHISLGFFFVIPTKIKHLLLHETNIS